MLGKNVPALPSRVRELGITEEQWQRAHCMPLIGGPNDIAMLLGISPLLLETEDKLDKPIIVPTNITLDGNWSQVLDGPEEDYSRRLPFIKLELVDPNPFQSSVRISYDAREIEEVILQLTESFRKGDLRAFVLHVRPNPDAGSRYQLIYGHLRLEAARRIGVEVLPGVISSVPDQQMFRQLIEENEQRCQPSIVSVAQQVRYAIEHFNWRLPQLAGLYHRSEKYIRMLYRLAYAPPPFLQFVHDHEEYARVFTEMLDMRLDEHQQAGVLELLKRPEATPGLVRQHLNNLPAPSAATTLDTSPKATEVEVVEAIYREYPNEPGMPARVGASLSLNQTPALANTVIVPAQSYNPKASRPLHLTWIEEEEEAGGYSEEQENTFSLITSFEKTLLERLETTIRQIEALSENEGLSDQFSLKLIEASQRFTRFL